MSDLNFEKMLEAAPYGVLVFGVSGSLLFSNQKGRDTFLPDAAMDCHEYNLFQDAHRIEAADMERIQLAFSGQPVEVSALCISNGANSETWLDSFFDPSFSASGELHSVTAYLYDISQYHSLQHQLMKEMEAEQKLTDNLSQAQRQLQQSEKLATVGQLAAGIAHEINNPIGYIGSNINTLKSYIVKLIPLVNASQEVVSSDIKSVKPEDADFVQKVEELRSQLQQDDMEYLLSDLTDIVDECAEGISRVKSIVTDMKGVAHSNDDERDWIDIHAAIDTALNIANNEIKYKAIIKKEYAELPKLFCSSSQMNQIFLNLLVNASHAISDSGVITIRTRTAEDNVEIDIEDTGEGIDEPGISKIFDTFYTTKPADQGTGLGLSIVKDIITRHSGEISVRSQPGQGTCFTISLPIGDAEHDIKDECIQGAA